MDKFTAFTTPLLTGLYSFVTVLIILLKHQYLRLLFLIGVILQQQNQIINTQQLIRRLKTYQQTDAKPNPAVSSLIRYLWWFDCIVQNARLNKTCVIGSFNLPSDNQCAPINSQLAAILSHYAEHYIEKDKAYAFLEYALPITGITALASAGLCLSLFSLACCPHPCLPTPVLISIACAVILTACTAAFISTWACHRQKNASYKQCKQLLQHNAEKEGLTIKSSQEPRSSMVKVMYHCTIKTLGTGRRWHAIWGGLLKCLSKESLWQLKHAFTSSASTLE